MIICRVQPIPSGLMATPLMKLVPYAKSGTTVLVVVSTTKTLDDP
jgi:hypothetical protein